MLACPQKVMVPRHSKMTYITLDNKVLILQVLLKMSTFRTDFIITASNDGHVKFWKKCDGEGIEFVKHFRSHLGKFFFFRGFLKF
jgi:peptidylprolyl isomerase domain and WD repeat-containing protein 1